MKLFLVLIVASIQVFAAPFRVVVPKVSDVQGYSSKEGELAFDSSEKSLKVYRSGFKNVSENGQEHLPFISKKNATQVKVGPGKIILDSRIRRNDSAITCSYSTSGIGGTDTPSTATAEKNYLYLVIDPVDIKKFNCIISDSDSGPVSVTGPFKKITTYLRTSFFVNKNGYTDYIGGNLLFNFNPQNFGTCTQISFSSMPSEYKSYSLVGGGMCSPYSGGQLKVFTDPACDPSSLIIDCTSLMGGANLILPNLSNIYVSGNLTIAHTIFIDSAIEEIK